MMVEEVPFVDLPLVLNFVWPDPSTVIVMRVPMTIARTLQRQGTRKLSDLATLRTWLIEHLGVTYRGYLEQNSSTMEPAAKMVVTIGTDKKQVPPIQVPMMMTRTERFSVELNGKVIPLVYHHGLLDKLPEKPRYLFGLHNRPELPTGTIAVMEGPVMAGKSHFTITLHGKSGHGGSPHKCTDVIVAGAAVVNALQTVVSRDTDPLDSVVCSVLSIHAGTPDNFVPDVLTMTGSIRFHQEWAHQKARRRLEELTTGVAAAYGCTAEVAFHPGVPATVNSPELTALARKAALELVKPDKVATPRPDMGSEDFAVFGQHIPAFFYWLGSGFPGQANPCWHNEHFRTDDSALPLAAALLAQSALVGLASLNQTGGN